MSRSIESNSESTPEPNPRGEFSRLDTEETVIRRDELLEAPASSMGFRQTTSHLLGKQLDHFLIESLVGTGGMGAVFRGRDIRLDREVAIKVVPIADRSVEAMRRFRVEAQSAAKLDHPNIARVYYVGETERWSYIVFEFVEGTNLRELVQKQGLLSIDDAVGLTRQVAEALQHAFERKVVHRDIKPSNILVTQTGQAKLVDMGLARTTEMDKSTNDLTASGVTLGTFDYISPEQAHDPRQADVRSDIYSLGCTLYSLLTGQPPFPEGTALQKLLMHGTKMPEDPRLFRADISDSMIAILRKMMAKKPSDRYQEPADLIHDLRTLAEMEGLVWASYSDNATILPASAQRTWLEATLPLLISLSAIFGITFWLQSNSYLSATFRIPRVDFAEVTTSPAEAVSDISAIDKSNNAPNPDSATDSQKKSVSPGETVPQNTVASSPKISKPMADLTERETLIVDPDALNDGGSASIVRTLEQAIEIASKDSQISRIVIRASSLSTSLNSLKAMISMNSNLTIQCEPGERCLWNIEGSESPTDPVSSLAWFECLGNQLLLQDIDVFWRVNSMSRRRSLFSVRSNGWLQFKSCSITVQQDPTPTITNSIDSSPATFEAALPSIIVIDSGTQDSFSDASTINAARLPARISGNQLSVRGQCDWLRLPSPTRTEVQIENSWLAIAGCMFDMNGSRNAVRTGVALRIDLRKVTAYSQRAWMRTTLSNSQPNPIPFVRTARECVFAGSKTLIYWNASDCDEWKIWDQSDQGNELLRWIDLRGADNVYDATTLSDYLLIKLNDGQLEKIGLATNANLVSEERGLETIAYWRKQPLFDPNRIHDATFDSLEWNPSSFHPGFQSQP